MRATNLKVTDEQVGAIFDQADTNHDGEISYDEAYNFIKSNMGILAGILGTK